MGFCVCFVVGRLEVRWWLVCAFVLVVPWRFLKVGWCLGSGGVLDVSAIANLYAAPLRGPYFPAEESRQRRCAWSLPCMILAKQGAKWWFFILLRKEDCTFCVGSLRFRSGFVPNWLCTVITSFIHGGSYLALQV